MVDAWMAEAWRLLQHLAGTPDSDVLLVVLVGAGLVGGLVTLSLLSGPLGSANANGANNLGGLVLGFLLVIGAASAVPVFLRSSLPEAYLQPASIAAAVLAFLLLAVPLLAMWHRTRYASALVALLLSGAVAVLVMVAGRAVADAVQGGKHQVGREEQRLRDARNLLSH